MPHATPRPANRTHCPACGAVLVWAPALPIRYVCPNGHPKEQAK